MFSMMESIVSKVPKTVLEQEEMRPGNAWNDRGYEHILSFCFLVRAVGMIAIGMLRLSAESVECVFCLLTVVVAQIVCEVVVRVRIGVNNIT